MSIEAIIQTQSFQKNRDNYVYRLTTEAGFDSLVDPPASDQPLPLNIDPAIYSDFLQPKGPIRAREHGLHNFNSH